MNINKLILAGLCCLSVFACIASEHKTLISETVIDNIKKRVDTGEHVSIVLGVIDHGSSEQFLYGHTTSAKENEVTADTLYSIGSLTKVFTGILLGKLTVDNQLELKTPFYKYLHNSSKPESEFGRLITIRELATHLSGLPRLPSNLNYTNPSQPYEHYTQDKLFDYIKHYEWSSPPYSFEYSNTGYGLLGQVAQHVSNASYETVLKSSILTPLAMTDTTITLDEADERQMASGHVGHITVPTWQFASLQSAGALKSTLNDMMTFLKGNIEPASTSISEALSFAQNSQTVINNHLSMGLGWFLLKNKGNAILYHNGETGGYYASMVIDPASKKAVVALTNSKRNLDDLVFHVLDKNNPLRVVKDAIVVPVEILQQYTGLYQLTPEIQLEVQLKGNVLMAQATNESAYPIFAETTTKFFYRAFDANISFVKDDAGVVKKIKFRSNGVVIDGEKIK